MTVSSVSDLIITLKPEVGGGRGQLSPENLCPRDLCPALSVPGTVPGISVPGMSVPVPGPQFSIFQSPSLSPVPDFPNLCPRPCPRSPFFKNSVPVPVPISNFA